MDGDKRHTPETSSAHKNQTNPTTSSTVSGDQEGQYRGRIYTCSFCDKGFSNAQALGGHMNIHKRDRARLFNAADSDMINSKEVLVSCSSRPCRRQELLLLFDDKPREKKSAGDPAPEEPDLELRLGYVGSLRHN